ncbi:hypothetical protein GUITHDRAFT_156466 [Guillardia theta CCMP2712]|uniref:Uncharacterized protein n=1 Tax=Guillardia theta (strain CCMP2712) TaxID=905079 RepID=L1I753_GUITC|nr:hypothetical protein GUITHDRAFT_156466 [Guillardia theta CCMP2712]EKX31897.1 hypothetical protein GUITHDRAFT_156466 [Guillardia theta CCMP2712]|mmetsp:Transcript_38661/g.121814  ORF Transcript_38661/g.121814 Transcript_38661/m.121814 type:complete len:87 (-) Transcript_38661:210-470(-)|eukprot:XP_005818877.1 hypothetical protein GUITHDRAFT_156466 [Guillardia theta CCMP2712]
MKASAAIRRAFHMGGNENFHRVLVKAAVVTSVIGGGILSGIEAARIGESRERCGSNSHVVTGSESLDNLTTSEVRDFNDYFMCHVW